MFIVWSGFGFLVPVLFFLILIIAESIGLSKLNMALSVTIVAPLVIWFTGRYFNNPANDKIVIDKETGQEIRLISSKHTLFWIQMQWWAVPSTLIGAIMVYNILIK
jgi:hypothetical protein